ncbi:MAG TPA: beta-galactosidase [Anaerolineae bacterium]|nr:beta-galactosidase [Anaerolineae bacterium]
MFPHILYGGDYNPEQWDESVWQEDARLMNEAGVNLVSLGIFAWAKLEPAAGQYDFAWLDRIMDVLHAHGVQVDLATPTASPPPWLVRAHPELLPVTAEGVTLWHGARRHYCPHSTAYREHAARIVRVLAEHARHHPALAMWHVDNEYAGDVSECFCENSAAAFRVWLERRYGTLETLNAAWGTAFWSQRYGDWQEIAPPRRAPTFINPTQLLDWQRFCSDSWLDCFEEQRAILKEITPNVPLTTNFMRFFKPLDYWKWAAREDVVSNDNYPDPLDPGWMIESAMGCDLMRSLKEGQAWMLMEQATANVNWRQRNATKAPGVMRLGSYQAVARGANGVLFFQWRASQVGSEKFHSGMVPHAGTATRVWREVKTLGAELQALSTKYAALIRSRVQADVAILFDWDNWWAIELGGKPLNDLRLFEQVKKVYAEFYRRHITVDFARPDADLSKYRLVVAPHLYLVRDASAKNLEQYVARGGTLVMNFMSGIVDPQEHIRLGGYPAPFRNLLGLWIEEFVVYGERQANEVETAEGNIFASSLWSDVIHSTGAQVLGRYRCDFIAGGPAITRHAFGRGVSYYIGTELNSAGLGWILERACAEANVHSIAHAAPTVELTTRTDGTQTWLFALNHGEQVAQLRVHARMAELLGGGTVGGTFALEPRGVAILEFENLEENAIE